MYLFISLPNYSDLTSFADGSTSPCTKISLNSSLSEYGNVRIREEDKKVIIEFLVPGWKKNDLLLSLDEQKLTLTSAIKNEKEQNSWFQNNNLNFEIQLGQNLDTTKTNAKLEEGVLTVCIPVSQKTKGRNIKIS